MEDSVILSHTEQQRLLGLNDLEAGPEMTGSDTRPDLTSNVL
jgi:hypothetical protein